MCPHLPLGPSPSRVSGEGAAEHSPDCFFDIGLSKSARHHTTGVRPPAAQRGGDGTRPGLRGPLVPRELGRQGLRTAEMNHLLAMLAAACCLCESRSWEGRPPRPSSVVISAPQRPGQHQWTPGSSGAKRPPPAKSLGKTVSLPCSPAEGPSVRGGSRAAGAGQVEELPGAVVWPEECDDLCP